ncbi:hypothetical protein AAG747_21070 [Rapidithrix thailandica]|uniref:Uncharacterized protein n=1 Tax=Rapidithrix thailandica TaxID=413964 RepID=A0AAW9RZU5_9BACT
MEEQIEELDIHRKNELISKTLYDKLKEYFESGGSLDTDDWLFYVEHKFEDESLLDIPQLQQERNSQFDFNESRIFKILKENGFFENQEYAPSQESRKILNKRFVEETVSIASLDNSKMMHFDLEGDVMKENNSYTVFLEEMEVFTKGIFSPTNIIEKWKSSEGPIEVQFVCGEDEYNFKPSYYDDWYDLGQPLTQINGMASIQ